MEKKGYTINKGVGKTVEFKGLKAQYFTAFFVGIFVLVLLCIIMAACGVNFIINLGLVLSLAGVMLYVIFTFNKKYGEHGLTKLIANAGVPKRICRISTYKTMLLSTTTKR